MEANTRTSPHKQGKFGYAPLPTSDDDTFQIQLGFKDIIYEFIHDPFSSFGAHVYSLLMIAATILSVVELILQTIAVFAEYSWWLYVSCAFISLFTLDIVLRFVSARSYKQLFTSFLFYADLLSVIPFFITLNSESENLRIHFQAFRAFRLFRLFRMYSWTNYMRKMKAIHMAMQKSAVAFMLGALLLLIAIIVFGTLMFYAERGVWDQDKRLWMRCPTNGFSPCTPSPFQSVLHATYWATTTMTTVGYGDEVPIYPTGKFIACAAMVCGLIVAAFPVSVLGNNFSRSLAILEADTKEIIDLSDARIQMTAFVDELFEENRIDSTEHRALVSSIFSNDEMLQIIFYACMRTKNPETQKSRFLHHFKTTLKLQSNL